MDDLLGSTVCRNSGDVDDEDGCCMGIGYFVFCFFVIVWLFVIVCVRCFFVIVSLVTNSHF